MRESFYDMTRDIMSSRPFLETRRLPHHGGDNSLYIHSVDTARCACRLARWFHMPEDRVRSVTRAALLHDFFGYDRQGERHRRFLRRYSGWQRVRHMHAFIHGPHAAARAGRLYGLSDRQRSAIASHMFPLAAVPKNSEAWVLTLADKLVASREMGETAAYHIRKLLHRRKRKGI